MREQVRRTLRRRGIVLGLSGGVDSSVAAVLIHEAIGDQLTCIYVDHGLMRAGESEEVVKTFRDRFNIKLVHRDASDLFLGALDGVTDPEIKRKTIGRLFVEVFDEEARAIGGKASIKRRPEPVVIKRLSHTTSTPLSVSRRMSRPAPCFKATTASGKK